jgi:hypothetical protein
MEPGSLLCAKTSDFTASTRQLTIGLNGGFAGRYFNSLATFCDGVFNSNHFATSFWHVLSARLASLPRSVLMWGVLFIRGNRKSKYLCFSGGNGKKR